eukprot:TRINITY_DN4865_c2_g1_i2.p1 TRINITY_DN4865_c2_g1~~TRINITY_DN4865_c2_g1_i2.p1  ORF type:complete len:203 (+),score=47.40 TRINITY_DN4865_c2_g1_i2:47-655(+)
MATKIYIVRHGQDEDNAALILNGHRDMPLTEMGREQAKAVAAKIATIGVDAVLASPLQRANFTGRAIHEACNLPKENFHTIDILKERDFGVLTGQPVANIQKVAGDSILQTDKVTYFLEVPGAEVFPDLLTRGRTILDFVNENFAGKKVVLVGHGDINKMIRAAYLNWTWEEGLKTAYVGNTDVIELPPADGTDPHQTMKFE